MGAPAVREINASTVLRVYKAIHVETPSTARNVKALISQICSYDAPDTSEVLGRFQGSPQKPAPVLEVDKERWGRREAGY
jgi:hypothetical protein